MSVNLDTYRNNYFNFYIDFPHEWRFRGDEPSDINGQQNKDNVPKENGDHKTLLFASYQPSTSMTSKCNFSISVHRKKDYFDLLEFSKEKIDVVERQYSLQKFLGCDSQEVKIKQIYDDKQLITKVVIWNESPEIWISAVAEGSSSNNFDVAESMFSQMHRIR